MLIVGTGQSGGQIAEDLFAAGREVHLAVSTCPEAPRRYRGHDILYWLLQAGIHGPEHGDRLEPNDSATFPAYKLTFAVTNCDATRPEVC